MGKRHRGRRPRKINIRRLRKRFLIVCEGEKTEPSYFKTFPVNAEVRIHGAGANTLSLVQAAERLTLREGPFDEVWLVYDKDEVPAGRFNAAAEKAYANGFRVAWSNPCFELWYLLHFQDCTQSSHHGQLIRRLEACFPGGYRKNDPRIYEKLLTCQDQAVKNAAGLVDHHGTRTPASANPCTLVHLLVTELNRHLH